MTLPRAFALLFGSLLLTLTLPCTGSDLDDRREAIEQALTGEHGTIGVRIGVGRLRDEDRYWIKDPQNAGLITVQEVPQAYWDAFLSQTQGVGTPAEIKPTEKLLKLAVPLVAIPIPGSSFKLILVKVADDRVDKILTDDPYAGPLATPGEKHRIVLGTYRHVPNAAAAVVGAPIAIQKETAWKFRCIVKYDQFSEQWTVVAFDYGLLGTDNWRSSRVR